MEGVICTQSVHDKTCLGCKKFQRDVMVTFLTNKGGEFYDLFLNNNQAQVLAKDLQKIVDRNINIVKQEKRDKKWYNKAIRFIKDVYKMKFNHNRNLG